jgi:hypothetical protein
VVVTRAPLLIAAAMLAGGCGGSGATPSPSPTPSAGAFTSSAFDTVVPHGWSDETQNQNVVAAVSVSGTVLMLLIAPPTQSNVLDEHIDVSEVSTPVPDDQLSDYLTSVSQRGATQLSLPQTFVLDGVSGLFITYDYTPAGGIPHRIEDMVVNRNTVTYEIVLNTAATDFSGQQPALQQVLSAWTWTS